MTAVDVDAIDAARAEATPGPWRRNCQPGVIFGGSGKPFPIAAGYTRPDAALIVAAVNALPGLLAEVRRGRALREAVGGLADQWEAEAFGDGRGTINAAPALFADRLRAVLAAGDGES